MFTYVVKDGEQVASLTCHWSGLTRVMDLHGMSPYTSTVQSVSGINSLSPAKVEYFPLTNRLVVGGEIGPLLLRLLRELGFRSNHQDGTYSAMYTLWLAGLFEEALKSGEIPVSPAIEADPGMVWRALRLIEAESSKIREEMAATSGPQLPYLLRSLEHNRERAKLINAQYGNLLAVFAKMRMSQRIWLKDGRAGVIDRVNDLSVGVAFDGGKTETVPYHHIERVEAALAN